MHKLSIVQLNDIHGYMEAHSEMFIENNEEVYRHAGGYARIASLLHQYRSEHPDGVIALDNGDTFHGTYPVIKTKGEGLLPILNEMELDGMTAHWEFAYGPKQVEKLAESLNYPMLACNCFDENTDELVFPSHTIVDRADLRIGIIGIAEHIVDKTMPAHFSEGVYFTLGVEELPPIIKKLREEANVDLIIVLSHFGFPQEVQLAKEVEGIDVLLSGHTHNALREPVAINDTIIIQSGCHGAHIGKLTLNFKDKRIESYEHTLVEVEESVEENKQIANKIKQIKAPHEKMLSEIVGQTNTPLHRYAQLETTMDNFLLAALLDVTNAEIAFSNGWRYGAPIPKGPITMEDLWNIIPTNPLVSTVKLSGSEIIDMLEENLENTFAANPYEQMGGYVKRCLGLTMYVKLENPPGTRIQQLFIGKNAVEYDKLYDAAFVTVQGVPTKYGVDRENLSLHAIDALKKYVKRRESIDTHLFVTVRIV